MDVILKTSPKVLTSETTFSHYHLIVDAYSNIPKLYGVELITTEEVMHKLDMFQDRFLKYTSLAGGFWKEFHQIQVRSLHPRSSRMNIKPAVSGLC